MLREGDTNPTHFDFWIIESSRAKRAREMTAVERRVFKHNGRGLVV